jgi:hypothetical protein
MFGYEQRLDGQAEAEGTQRSAVVIIAVNAA